LLRSPDPVKDQTYFLAYLTQEQLSRVIFPIGKFNKSEIRQLAAKYNLPTKNRKNSQGICFLGHIKFREFIKHHLGELEGDIIDIDSGNVIGSHPGYYYYTIGQRSGLGLGGGPWYVIKKDVNSNIVYISKENKADREKYEFKVGKFNWISGNEPENKNYMLKIRHGANFHTCSLTVNDDGTGDVELEKPDTGIASGQFAVFYDGDICLGGGVIL
jgi:tRNA-5-taurinomethyluridine 2-sulfurtransferase